ncbi:MAG: CHASE4 domain-containing protein [Methanoregula sp.]
MDLRTKTVVIFIIGLLVTLSFFIGYSSYFLKKSYEDIEITEVNEDLQRVGYALDAELADLDSRLSDWAPWDETYTFALGKNPEYIQDNLQKDTFSTLDLTYLLVYNRSEGLVYARAYNKTTNEFEQVSPLFLSTITRDYPLFNFTYPEAKPKVLGLFFVDGQPIAVAAQPVLKSDWSGPSAGVMIMGRNLNENRVQGISKATGVSVRFIDPITVTGSQQIQSIQDHLRKDNTIVIQKDSQDTISGYIALNELNITPAEYVIEISRPRVMYQSGLSALSSFLLVFFLAVLIFGISILLIIDQLVLSRVSTITNDVQKVGLRKEKKRITELKGNDELTQLSRAINQMLDQTELLQVRYKSIVEDQTEMICRFLQDGTLTFTNPSFDIYVKNFRNVSPLVSIYDSFLPQISKDTFDKFLTILTPQSPIRSGEQDFRYEGLEFSISWTIRGIFDQDGKVQEYQFVGRDITIRKQMRDALQKANRQLNLLLSITRHDIRNHLMALKTYLVLGESSLDDPGQLAEIFEKAQCITENIEHQIDFTKDYENLGANPPVWQNVGKSVQAALKELDLEGVEMNVGIPQDLEIIADPLLKKMFFNLVDNALRHGGEAVTKISLSTHESDNRLLIVFEDDGSGVLPDKKEIIFSRGYGKNTGYGLFLIREILSITGITIKETGEPGKGARFEITVPEGAYRFKKPD